MSKTTISVRSAQRNARLEELRRREAEAREAARQAARRAAEKRQREEAERRRTDAANHAIADAESRFQRELARLDQARRHLPDLIMSAPKLPGLTNEAALSLEKLERYAGELASIVRKFSGDLDRQIAEAERQLRRRVAKAEAWRTALELEKQLSLTTRANTELAARLSDPAPSASSPKKPAAEADLEAVETYVQEIRAALADAKSQQASFDARIAARARAVALAGSTILAKDAGSIAAAHKASIVAQAQSTLREHVATVLSDVDLRAEDLSGSVRSLIEDALEHAQVQGQQERITRWIAREKHLSDCVQWAMDRMRDVPDFVHDDESLSRRWSNLLARLQQVASGLAECTPSLEREYAQLCADAHRGLNSAYTKADWLQAMSEEGFEIFERVDGPGLVVVDLDHPEVWLEATELEPEDHGFAAILELKTDAASSASREADVTSDICARLGRVAGSDGHNISAAAEIVESDGRISRGRRPPKSQLTFAQRL